MSARIKVAILLGAPLSRQNLERTGIPWLSLHFDVVVFNCLPWLDRSESGMHHEQAKWEPLETVANARDFRQALARHRPNYSLDFIGLCRLTPEIQHLLAQAHTHFVVQKSGSLPTPTLASRLVWRLRLLVGRKSGLAPAMAAIQAIVPSAADAITPVSPPSLLLRLAERLRLRASLLAPDLTLAAGKASLDFFSGRARQVLWIGSQDYHTHRQAVNAKALQDQLPERYIVFIDDNLPFASDWSLLGMAPPVTPDTYYSALRGFLSRLELAWNLPVIVAGHPSGKLDERLRKGFGQRLLLFGQTAQLVKNAQAVLVHASTAVSFAVLDRKPLLFLTSDELREGSFGLQIQTMAKRLGLRPLNMDSATPPPGIDALPLDEGRYRAYEEDFLCASYAGESAPWQIFTQHLLSQQQGDAGRGGR
ncbi:EKC/KEOPS complex subunit CGI121/TPRKB [Laribacter hongkongensis]|uniref:EKC/KEOPS complex subunit CGI121/TPRKB n=1 Tax=Laribacter hongkongensis TaxID=168471 RepID=UPI001EFC3B93|nr:EKC/KEOPS complex subunit CGI121/TPRKB [Laribacter hongkongensis]MCG8995488.1 EKC/KEOPS complex subunit CGI121/TPRKB [Laribacter hongkongensis]MCG9010305.1 EKC/KEOPS complex subunit CGI121/TPRKB [Laribacter hongkongensis]MCG9046199.1 EKC/KEOPS complex subunit CGI121/TPRKB [Laribacter hongkongensis]MCG9073771.1 EKC/KEOPS complex subunit CGI121/TPRKB [Laribacter hongkongensis]